MTIYKNPQGLLKLEGLHLLEPCEGSQPSQGLKEVILETLVFRAPYLRSTCAS